MPKPLIVTLIVITAIIVMGLVGWLWFSQELRPVSTDVQTQRFEVAAGSGNDAISKDLSRAGLIRSSLAFNIYVSLEGLTGRLQAGDFFLSPSQSTAEIAKAIAGGMAVDNEVTVVIPEGLTDEQVASLVASKFSSGQNLNTADSDMHSALLQSFKGSDLTTANYPFLSDRPAKATLEGYLFPDTYRFFKDATPNDVRKKLLDTFGQKVAKEIRDQAAADGHTFFEVLTLASILEKELRTTTDRRLASDLFWRRLEMGMPLQSDATVNYVTKKSLLQPTLDDLKVENAYNTYLNPGLPPGPISNPGLDSIQAVLNPTPNDYLYYLTDPSGKAHFAETYTEHLLNKATYLK